MLEIEKVALDGWDEYFLRLGLVLFKVRSNIDLKEFKWQGTMPGDFIVLRVELIECSIICEDLI